MLALLCHASIIIPLCNKRTYHAFIKNQQGHLHSPVVRAKELRSRLVKKIVMILQNIDKITTTLRFLWEDVEVILCSPKT